MSYKIYTRMIFALALVAAANILVVPSAQAGPDTGKALKQVERVFSMHSATWERARQLNERALKTEADGDCEAAERLYQEAYETRKSVTGEGPFEILGEVIDPLVGLSRCLASRGKIEEALKIREQEWEMRGWTQGIEGEKTLAALDWIKANGETQLASNPSDVTKAIMGRVYANRYLIDRQDLAKVPLAARPDVIKAAIEAYDLSQTRRGGGNIDEAELLLEATLMQRWDLEAQSFYGLEARFRLTDAWSQRSRTGDAEQLAAGLVFDAVAKLGESHPSTIIYMITHARLVDAIGYEGEALGIARQAEQRAAGMPAGSKARTLAQFHALVMGARASSTATGASQILSALAALTKAWGPTHRQSLLAGTEAVYRLIATGAPVEALAIANQTYQNAREAGFHLYVTEAYQEPVAYASLYNPSTHERVVDLLDMARMVVRDNYGVGRGLGYRDTHDERLMRQFGRWGLDALRFNLPTLSVERKKWVDQTGLQYAQDALKGGAAAAVAESAAINWAHRKSPEVGRAAELRKSLVERWDTIDRAVFARLSGNPIPEGFVAVGNLARERTEIRKRVRDIDLTLEMEAPVFQLLRKPTYVRRDKIQQHLKEDEAMLLLVPTEFATHSYLITKSGTNWHRSDWNEELVGGTVRALLMDVGANVEMETKEYIQWETRNGNRHSFDRSAAHALYNELIAPHSKLLEGKTHLFFAAGGILSSLPLSVLVTEPPEGEDDDPAALRSTAWMADKYATVQVPSVNAWSYLRTEARVTQNNYRQQFAGFGDPVLNGNAQARGSAIDRRRNGTTISQSRNTFARSRSANGNQLAEPKKLSVLAALPGTAVELEAMRSALSADASTVHLRELATETAIKTSDLSKISILAFATHGLVAGEVSEVWEPGLVFTPPAASSPLDDGFLTASEVAKLDLNAQWVILSACNTAAGDGSDGALGLSGLASAFFYAGAENLLASHWPVRDDVAPILTVRTIEMARDDPNMSRAQAFQRAMREIRNDKRADGALDSWAHPTAWAPFTLIGDR